MKILFVCTGNTCRSPMAATLLRAKVHNAGQSDKFTIASAGLAAETDAAATDNARQTMRQMNLSLTEHRAKLLTLTDVETADLILTMTLMHKLTILNTLPGLNKIYTLAEYSNSEQEITDPYGGDDTVYWNCAILLDKQITAVWEKLQQ